MALLPWRPGASRVSFEVQIMNKFSSAVRGAAGAAIASAAGVASAANPTSAADALTTLAGDVVVFGPLMWGVAIAAVGILVGVKWIKRAKGAA